MFSRERRQDRLHRARQSREDDHRENCNSKLRDERLNGEVLFGLAEAQALIDARRRHDNIVGPHSSLGCRPPAPETIFPPGRSAVQWASAPAVGSARPPTTNVA
jgi:hypothetical protein